MPVLLKKPKFETFADVLAKLGVPAHRVLLAPRPGTATVKDVIRHVDGDYKHLVELIDGNLVEKSIGIHAAYLAMELGIILGEFNRKCGNVAMVLGADAMFQLMPKLVRLPDVSLTNWDRIPGRVVPNVAVSKLVPDFAVEAISKSNTTKEMSRKLRDYFQAGIRVVWFIYPVKRIVRVFASPTTIETSPKVKRLMAANSCRSFNFLSPDCSKHSVRLRSPSRSGTNKKRKPRGGPRLFRHGGRRANKNYM